MTSHGRIQHPVIVCSPDVAFWLSCVYNVAFIMPIPVMQLINFFLSIVIGDVNISKINVK